MPGLLDIVPEQKRAFHPPQPKLKRCKTIEAACRTAGIDWLVEKRPIEEWSPDGPVPLRHPNGSVAMKTVRSDSGSMLGIITDRYQPIQNIDAFSVAGGILKESGATVVGGGSAKHGTFVWLELQLNTTITVAGDEILPYLLFVNSHRGDRAVKVINTPTRRACWNQLGWFWDNAPRRVSIRHVGNTQATLAEAHEIMGYADAYNGIMRKVGDKLALNKVTAQRLNRWLEMLYPPKPGMTERSDMSRKEAQETVRWMVNEGPTLQGHHGTAWAFVNAAVEIADWGSGRQREQMARLCGEKDLDLKNRALKIAMDQAGIKLSSN